MNPVRKLSFFPFLVAVMIGGAAGAGDNIVTIQGLAQETKDGMYVADVMIPDSALPKGQSISQFIGKKVEVKGLIEQVNEPDPNEGKDPAKDPISQARTGYWQYMKKIESIRIMEN